MPVQELWDKMKGLSSWSQSLYCKGALSILGLLYQKQQLYGMIFFVIVNLDMWLISLLHDIHALLKKIECLIMKRVGIVKISIFKTAGRQKSLGSKWQFMAHHRVGNRSLKWIEAWFLKLPSSYLLTRRVISCVICCFWGSSLWPV